MTRILSRFDSRAFIAGAAILLAVAALSAADPAERHFLYVAEPGIRDYVELGGAGILVFDMDRGYAFVKRIETPASRETKPDNMKGICTAPPPSGSISPRRKNCIALIF